MSALNRKLRALAFSGKARSMAAADLEAFVRDRERAAAEKALTDAADELDGYDLSLGSDKRPPDGDWHVDIGYYGEANWLRARAAEIREAS